MTLRKAWRRWLAALIVSLGAHAAMLGGLLLHNQQRTMTPPAVIIELLPMPEPRKPLRTTGETLREPPIETAAPSLSGRAITPEVQPEVVAPAPTFPAPAHAPAAAGPEPLYAGRPQPKRRSCWEGRLSDTERVGCAELAARTDKRFDPAESRTFDGPLASVEQVAAYHAKPRLPLFIGGDSDEGLIIGFTIRKKF